jgi:hypothetical protein
MRHAVLADAHLLGGGAREQPEAVMGVGELPVVRRV